MAECSAVDDQGALVLVDEWVIQLQAGAGLSAEQCSALRETVTSALDDCLRQLECGTDSVRFQLQ